MIKRPRWWHFKQYENTIYFIWTYIWSDIAVPLIAAGYGAWSVAGWRPGSVAVVDAAAEQGGAEWSRLITGGCCCWYWGGGGRYRLMRVNDSLWKNLHDSSGISFMAEHSHSPQCARSDTGDALSAWSTWNPAEYITVNCVNDTSFTTKLEYNHDRFQTHLCVSISDKKFYLNIANYRSRWIWY